MSETSEAEKTEDPTPFRLEKARKEGQIPRSKELTSLLMLITGWALLWLGGQRLAEPLLTLVRVGLRFDHSLIGNDVQMLHHFYRLLCLAISALLPLVGGLICVALGASVLIGGLVLNSKSLKPDLQRLNPLAGLKRMFAKQLLAELIKTLLKASLVGMTLTLFLQHNWSDILRLLHAPLEIALGDALKLVAQCVILIILSLLPMVGYDVFYQLTSHIKKLRMSRQDIRDEFKQQEGNPEIKGRIRQQQRAMARRRMMTDVPKADVIVNNPTHYSVALRYREGGDPAPRVVAKGAGLVALRIRQIAEEHRIPMLEAPPLARALYRHAEIGQPVPVALYSAVAEVLAWVYGLRRWRKQGGLIPRKPKNIAVPAALDFQSEAESEP